MGRLEDIIARNQDPRRHRKNAFPFGIAVAVFVFIILVLWVFTDLAKSPDDKPDPRPPSHDHHVDGIYLGSPKSPPKRVTP